MRTRIIPLLVLGVIAGASLALVATPDMALAFDGGVQNGVNAARGEGVPAALTGSDGIVSTIINVMLFIVGILSVIMLIYGGLRYVISGGNSSAVTSAKNTILYAIVGLIVALFAYAIINFVLGSITGGITPGGGGTNV